MSQLARGGRREAAVRVEERPLPHDAVVQHERQTVVARIRMDPVVEQLEDHDRQRKTVLLFAELLGPGVCDRSGQEIRDPERRRTALKILSVECVALHQEDAEDVPPLPVRDFVATPEPSQLL